MKHRLPPAERRCKSRGCRTVLCRYNVTDRCWACGGWWVEATAREQREAMADLVAGAR